MAYLEVGDSVDGCCCFDILGIGRPAAKTSKHVELCTSNEKPVNTLSCASPIRLCFNSKIRMSPTLTDGKL